MSRALALVLLALALSAAPAPAQDALPMPSPAETERILRELAAREVPGVSLAAVVIGESLQGRPILALEIGARGDDDEPLAADALGVVRRSRGRRPAILLVSGLEADRPLGPAVLVQLARDLLDRPAADVLAALAGSRLYLVPLAGPDGAQRRFDGLPSFAAPAGKGPLLAHPGNARVIDRDRDGRAPHEDVPSDLDGDGAITLMRVRDERGAFVTDPDDERLVRAAATDRGENGVWRVLTEGLDRDGDGAFGEDPPGGVDLARNFPHAFAEHDLEAGRLPLSEPETRALADYVLARPEIALAVIYGSGDDLTELPEVEDEKTARAGPRTRRTKIDPEDIAIWRQVADARRETGAVTGRAARTLDGSLAQWLYFHVGIPAFSVCLFHVPEKAEPDADGEGRKGAAESDLDAPQAEAAPRRDQDDQALEGETSSVDAAPSSGSEVTEARTRDPEPEPRATPTGEGSAASDLDARVAAEVARVRVEGFRRFRPHAHPQLGEVEIGGWIPYARALPGAVVAGAIATHELPFVLRLLTQPARVEVGEPVVTKLASGLFEIELRVANGGGVPTACAQAVRANAVGPVIAAIDLPAERVLHGERRASMPALAAGSGEWHLRWLVRGASGERVRIVVGEDKAAAIVEEVTLP